MDCDDLTPLSTYVSLGISGEWVGVRLDDVEVPDYRQVGLKATNSVRIVSVVGYGVCG